MSSIVDLVQEIVGHASPHGVERTVSRACSAVVGRYASELERAVNIFEDLPAEEVARMRHSLAREVHGYILVRCRDSLSGAYDFLFELAH
jgi:hypothetical protein